MRRVVVSQHTLRVSGCKRIGDGEPHGPLRPTDAGSGTNASLGRRVARHSFERDGLLLRRAALHYDDRDGQAADRFNPDQTSARYRPTVAATRAPEFRTQA
jgi:hypothetical protein